MRKPRIHARFKHWRQLIRRLLTGEERIVLTPRYRLVSFRGYGVITTGKILRSYRAGIDNMAVVYLVEDEEGYVRYIVEEPEPSEWVRKSYPLIMDHIAYTAPPLERYEDPENYVRGLVHEAAEELGVADLLGPDIRVLMYYVLRDVVGYGYIDVPMRDPRIEEIGATGPGQPVQVVHKDVGWLTWLDTNIVIESEDEMARFVQRLAQKTGRYISVAKPMLEAPSPEKHRLALALSEIGGKGSSFVVRKHPAEPYPVTRLVEWGTISSLEAAYLWLLLENYSSLFIVGVMATGKTTLLNVALSMVRPDWHICTVEDTPELKLPHPGWHPLYTRTGLGLGGGSLDIGLFDLTKLTLRLRCQVISVSEVRGEEAKVLIQAAATGHSSACTFHAGSIAETITRLTAPPLSIGPSYIRVLSAIAIMQRLHYRGKAVRRLRWIYEILPEPANGFPYVEVKAFGV
ncbi:MAG TPA: hypothetical protein EYP33_08395, partial [Pyrodictium sp.]|nr:hypothetical protein [Pyrodictium sp.]